MAVPTSISASGAGSRVSTGSSSAQRATSLVWVRRVRTVRRTCARWSASQARQADGSVTGAPCQRNAANSRLGCRCVGVNPSKKRTVAGSSATAWASRS